MTDPLETIREDMHQKPAQEFVRRQRHYFLALPMLIVLVGDVREHRASQNQRCCWRRSACPPCSRMPSASARGRSECG
jgi:hypothetical protein